MPYFNTGVSFNFFPSEIASFCYFMNIKVVFVKGSVTPDKLLLKECKEGIGLLNLEHFEFPKYPNKIYNLVKEIGFFSEWMISNKLELMEKHAFEILETIILVGILDNGLDFSYIA